MFCAGDVEFVAFARMQGVCVTVFVLQVNGEVRDETYEKQNATNGHVYFVLWGNHWWYLLKTSVAAEMDDTDVVDAEVPDLDAGIADPDADVPDPDADPDADVPDPEITKPEVYMCAGVPIYMSAEACRRNVQPFLGLHRHVHRHVRIHVYRHVYSRVYRHVHSH